MPQVTSLGHVGLYVKDYERAKDFYTRVLGLHLTDEDPQRKMAFLSAQPDTEHHEVLLAAARDAVGPNAVQQVSFHCASLGDVREFWKTLQREEVEIIETITHGNAVSVYFYDPERYRLEVYWDTGLAVRQPFKKSIDLSADDEGVMRQVRELVGAAPRLP